MADSLTHARALKIRHRMRNKIQDDTQNAAGQITAIFDSIKITKITHHWDGSVTSHSIPAKHPDPDLAEVTLVQRTELGRFGRRSAPKTTVEGRPRSHSSQPER